VCGLRRAQSSRAHPTFFCGNNNEIFDSRLLIDDLEVGIVNLGFQIADYKNRAFDCSTVLTAGKLRVTDLR